jgi:hypothetical protein
VHAALDHDGSIELVRVSVKRRSLIPEHRSVSATENSRSPTKSEDQMAKKTRRPCPAGIEDKCPIPRYRCLEFGEPGKHCFELFEEFEAFVLPSEETEEEKPMEIGEVERVVLEHLRAQGITEEDM